jgi:hypothetical protein
MLGHAGVQMPDMKQAYAALTLLDAALAASPETDAGWQLVPVKPTEEMIDAAHKVADGGQDDPTAALQDLWRDMLAAVPSPPKVTR